MRSVLPVLQDVGVRGCGSEYIDMWTRGCWKVSLKVYVYMLAVVSGFVCSLLPYCRTSNNLALKIVAPSSMGCTTQKGFLSRGKPMNCRMGLRQSIQEKRSHGLKGVRECQRVRINHSENTESVSEDVIRKSESVSRWLSYDVVSEV